MRTLAIGLVLAALGCGNDRPPLQMFDAKARFEDAPTALFDASTPFCDAPLDSAHVTMLDAGASTTLTRVYAGGVLESGPVAPSFTGPPMTIALLFTTTDHIPQETGLCCEESGTGCCMLDGARVSVSGGITTDNAVGSHPIAITSFQDAALQAQGTVTITGFVQPFDQAPGRVAGSISSSDGSLAGTFDNAFCPALLTATI